jgi:thiosulfate reductase cytochrome b subunit
VPPRLVAAYLLVAALIAFGAYLLARGRARARRAQRESERPIKIRVRR